MYNLDPSGLFWIGMNPYAVSCNVKQMTPDPTGIKFSTSRDYLFITTHVSTEKKIEKSFISVRAMQYCQMAVLPLSASLNVNVQDCIKKIIVIYLGDNHLC